ncbi:hypothetical protein F6W69_10555 [Microbacterium oxydans]|uniref:hypothetical protein n=1 Tax=Microbacterium oxydans TaxID=82380 RepID=UPI0011445A14|nr:hypothetical protein [Microbacterium oxydans]KAB1891031.1 hypothetical protein F6W69_10555 [Microbacterium oxydans]GED39109.1 hypothetical protein MOX01_22510 [Microbacterium oxydans]
MSTELNKHIQKLKDLGITISVTPSAGAREGFEDRPFGLIAQAAKEAGIYYEKGDAPHLTPSEFAKVTRFGIHEEDQEDEQ